MTSTMLAILLFTVAGTALGEECITWGGIERCWDFKSPSSAETAETSSMPLVIDLHGLTSTKENIQYYGLSTLYDSAGFFAAAPQGVGNSWNTGPFCCGAALSQSVDDDGFLLAMIDKLLAANPKIDPARVYVSGHSNGCIMSHRLALKYSERFAAMGCFSGGDLSGGAAPNYSPVPIIVVQGTADTTITYKDVKDSISKVSKDDNQCSNDPPTKVFFGSNYVETYTGCAAEVALVTIAGGVHSPFQSGSIFADLESGKTTQQYVWDFISRFALAGEQEGTSAPSTTPPTGVEDTSGWEGTSGAEGGGGGSLSIALACGSLSIALAAI